MALDLSEPLVVAALTEGLYRKTEGARKEGADAVELRIDMYDGGPEKALEDLGSGVGLPVIATNRPTEEETEEERADTLVRAAEHADAVDIDASSPNETVERVFSAARDKDVTVIASHHDFEGTPPHKEMWKMLEEAWELGDIAKLAVTPETRREAYRLLGLTLNASEDCDGPVATVAMGEVGSHTRVVAPLYGSCLTYASYGGGTAPGQLSVREASETLEILR